MLNKGAILCTTCDSTCSTCIGISINCTSCNSPRFLASNNSCLTNCTYAPLNLDYYGNTTTKTC